MPDGERPSSDDPGRGLIRLRYTATTGSCCSPRSSMGLSSLIAAATWTSLWGIDPADDNFAVFGHAGRWSLLQRSGVPPPAATADRTLMVLAKAPIRSRPPDRLVGVPLERRRPTVHS